MMRSLNFVISSIMIIVIVLGLSSPVKAQVSAPDIIIDAPSAVNVSTEFDVIISIHNIQSGWGMIGFAVQVLWDPNDLEYIECEFLGDDRPGWGGSCGSEILPGGGAQGDPWTEDAEWLRFRFHCLRAGPTSITVTSVDTVTLEPLGGGQSVNVFPEPVTVIVNQVAPVGGVVVQKNSLEILTPYIALAGLIIAVSTVYIFKRRKD